MKQKCVDSLEHIEYVNIQKKYFKHVRHTNRVCRGAPDFSDARRKPNRGCRGWCLLFVLIRQGLRGGSGPQRWIRALVD